MKIKLTAQEHLSANGNRFKIMINVPAIKRDNKRTDPFYNAQINFPVNQYTSKKDNKVHKRSQQIQNILNFNINNQSKQI